MSPLRPCLCLLLGFAMTTAPSTLPGDLQAKKPWTFVEGGVIRGDVSKKQIALIFTGGDFGEGTQHILNVLKRQDIRAGIFVTGDFLRTPELTPLVKPSPKVITSARIRIGIRFIVRGMIAKNRW